MRYGYRDAPPPWSTALGRSPKCARRTARPCPPPRSPSRRAAGRALAEYEAIFNALSTRDAALSQAAALLHVSNTKQWEHLRSVEPLPVRTTERK
ncbi:conserved hypothetical protein [Streptomyces sviceus ATCC 29083]|uniref:Uncharacterized protein n=1 Tax=Streptomyces sviceus (strain ATCC 29083 / DSM 924 / JCM 4929 / NBRC 13980 / NCIMB 11184 / NRRL 5439 / UC 5370) TaxID=463191 RepID=B5HRM2_STRX2|nr:conserved hypothetical protein [Streptomyces sviceus ATCC 29083]